MGCSHKMDKWQIDAIIKQRDLLLMSLLQLASYTDDHALGLLRIGYPETGKYIKDISQAAKTICAAVTEDKKVTG